MNGFFLKIKVTCTITVSGSAIFTNFVLVSNLKREKGEIMAN